MFASRSDLPDVQSESDHREIAINKVGVTGIRYPIAFQSRGADGKSNVQHTIGNWKMLVSLDKASKGTHMSRFLQILNDLQEPLSIPGLIELCDQVQRTLDAQDAYLEVDFPFFIEKPAPVTGMIGNVDFDVRFQVASGVKNSLQMELSVPGTSLCPCSKEISAYGAHNQRCELKAAVRFADSQAISIEELFGIVESVASTQVFSMLKRPDEKWVTEQAYDNPKFVEDIVRDLAIALNEDPRVSWYRCSSENFESIRSHNAYAQIERES